MTVSINTQLCSTILANCTVRRQICTLSTLVYTHTGVHTLFVPTPEVHYCTLYISDTTVQLYNTIAVPYACTLEQCTFLGNSMRYTLD